MLFVTLAKRFLGLDLVPNVEFFLFDQGEGVDLVEPDRVLFENRFNFTDVSLNSTFLIAVDEVKSSYKISSRLFYIHFNILPVDAKPISSHLFCHI
jgi:hypothetical protein